MQYTEREDIQHAYVLGRELVMKSSADDSGVVLDSELLALHDHESVQEGARETAAPTALVHRVLGSE